MNKLAEKKCVPCEEGGTCLGEEENIKLADELGGGWKVINDHHIEKDYLFNDFKEALSFTNQLGALAEGEGHHPDIHLSYGKVRVLIWTHSAGGLTENDFILAAKCDQIKIAP